MKATVGVGNLHKYYKHKNNEGKLDNFFYCSIKMNQHFSLPVDMPFDSFLKTEFWPIALAEAKLATENEKTKKAERKAERERRGEKAPGPVKGTKFT